MVLRSAIMDALRRNSSIISVEMGGNQIGHDIHAELDRLVAINRGSGGP